MNRIRVLLVAAGATVVLAATTVFGQPFPVPITQAIALLTSGTTTFSVVGIDSAGYINWGSGRQANGYGIRDNAGVLEAKNNGGAWGALNIAGGAPTTATYITQTPNGSLSAEQPLSALASALLLNTTATGVLAAYAGTSCTNQFARSLNALGVATCASVSMATDITGTLPVANGGTGAATLTGLLRGNGAAAMTALTSSTVGQVLRVTGADTFAFGAVDLDDTDAVTGTAAVANGGTNLAAGTSGGVLGFTAAGTIASSAALTANQLVVGGGAGATPIPLGSLGTATTVLHGNAGGLPTFGAINLATDVTGSIGVATGGTGLASYVIGDLLYASGTTALSTLADVSAGSFLRSGGVTTAPVWSLTKWPNAAATGNIVYASATNQYANLTPGAAGAFLQSGGVGAVPVWSTTAFPGGIATTGDIVYASATNTYSNLAAVATGRLLASQGVGVAPAWATNIVATSYQGIGTTATAGLIRMANTESVSARNNGNTLNIALLSSNATDQVVLGGTNASALTYGDGTRNLYWRTSAPTISSGFGTTPSVTGNASAFRVTVGGGGGGTTGVVLFNATWTTAPICQANNETSAQLVRATPTTTQVTLAGTFASSDLLAVSCVGF